MIQSLSNKYNKHIAFPLCVIFCLQWIIPLHATAAYNERSYGKSYGKVKAVKSILPKENIYPFPISNIKAAPKVVLEKSFLANRSFSKKPFIGGPSSPEATTFKAVGSDNLVNLFTGDFSYSIPLLDVGGYPVNLFYNGGITMDQEASWVGLGWNINPGTVSRNMRGVPDDFDGTDILVTHQNLKPNRTYGGEVGVDGEILGIKKPAGLSLNLSLGFSYNNYLGPELTLGAGAGAGAALVTIDNLKFDKSSTDSLGISLQASVNAKLSSRSGLTLSPSLNLMSKLSGVKIQNGIGLTTSYNSRSGISSINLHTEMGFYSDQEKQVYDKKSGKKYWQGAGITGSLGSSSISFAKPSFMPLMRMPMENSNLSGQLEAGAGLWGLRGAGTLTGYYSESKVPVEWQTLRKPLVGFMYSEKALANKDAVMDFNRVNDGEVTPNTPIISAPQYAYDVFSIQGEGTGGSIRAYRSDLGFMRDNITVSKDKSYSLGADIAPPGHWGGNFNVISAPTKAGGWDDAGSNTLIHTMSFKAPEKNSLFENVYFKNPGEATVTDPALLSMIGGEDLVRFQLSGSDANPRLESALELFNKKTGSVKGTQSLLGNTALAQRQKRTQVTTMLTADEASKAGLEKTIRNYTGTFDVDNNIEFANISRTYDFRKAHHISEIDVLEQNGMRYVYGIPVYNVIQKDFTFSVNALPANTADNLVAFTPNETSVNSPYMANKSAIDGYVQSQETPAYASSFLLTGLLSPDYVDVTGDGITEDDLGGAVKFDYQRSSALHKWRTPRNNSNGQQAHFNEGIRTQKEDNKATISYGEREAWYLSSIESKSMVAIFKTASRNDAKGVTSDMNGAINNSEDVNKKLARIDLYTKAEIREKGIANARPLKSVIFNYDSSLCKGAPDSKNGGGKLTLRSIYFSYNGQARLAKDKYVFDYGNLASPADNPDYAYNASDRWGTYKDPADAAVHPAGLNNIDYPYTDYNNKAKNDQFAGAWSLKKILMPSGGQMEIEYEADDYGYVQDRRACNMMNIYGLGNTTAYTSNGALYNNGGVAEDNNYVYVKLPAALTATGDAKLKEEIYSKYLEGIEKLAFKLQIHMPKGLEPLTVYAEIESYGVCSNSAAKEYIYIRLKTINNKSPLAISSIGYLTGNLPAQAFPGYKTEVDDLADFISLAGTMVGQLKNAFKNVDQQMRSAALAKNIDLERSFIRLDNPTRIKYGGGHRVKRILVRDNWKKMTNDNSYTSTYGQDYDYSTTEMVEGVPTTISSGVASYEPGIGSEENPFREIVQFSNKLPLASAQYGAIEMPILEGLYPSPMVGYSKVTVRSIHRKGTHGDSTVRSAIGKQVTEFFTARDYPVYATYTPMGSKSYNKNPKFSFLYKEIISRRTITQGFLVETNDMHGKMKSQLAYSESDEKTPLSASYHTYKNTGKNGFNDQVDFVYNEEGGVVRKGNIGIDVELMTDVREFKVESNGLNAQGQLDIFPLGVWIWTVFTLWPLKTYTENQYRAVTCTKLINYHAIDDSVIVMDKGSVISTKTIAYDAETGQEILTKTANEFNDPVYNTSYPSYWAYSGTGLAYKNINATYSGSFADGILTGVSMDIFESGDELMILNAGTSITNFCTSALSPDTVIKLWAYNKNKDLSALTDHTPSYVFMDKEGQLFTKSNVIFRIIRSGHRNTLGTSLGSVASMASPIVTSGPVRKLLITSGSKVTTSSAILFKEKWQADAELFKRYADNWVSCANVQTEDCEGYYQKSLNPYVKGLIGNLKPYRSFVFYGNRVESDPAVATTIRKNGYLSDFSFFWNLNTSNNMVPDISNSKWVWNSEVTKVNSKGQELETKDALNTYTSAQYGFNKNLALAVSKNSRYGESFSEGFEDNAFEDNINPVTNNDCTNTKYVNFTVSSSSAAIINSDTYGVKAHTGKSLIRILPIASKNMIVPLAVKNIIDSFHMPLDKDTAVVLANPGGILSGNTVPAGVYVQLTHGAADIDILNELPGFSGEIFVVRDYYLKSYFKVDIGGTYIVSSSGIIDDQGGGTGTVYQINLFDDITITDISSGAVMPLTPVSYSPFAMNLSYYKTRSVCLPKGIYEHIIHFHGSEMVHTPGFVNDHTYHCAFGGGPPFTLYKDLSTLNGCVRTKPIAATDSMKNQTFSLVPGKRMHFSAWAKEDCGNPAGTACNITSYTNSHAILQFNNGAITVDSIKMTGNIIEGWQKLEGDFTVPAGATSANLVLSNSGTLPIYLDDIRLHPYNANMKSYSYDPRTLRLAAELDENNYASFYEYDEEGQMIRVKKETIQGIKTIQETRNAKQQSITDIQ